MSAGCWSWSWKCFLGMITLSVALEVKDFFKFGEEAGDQLVSPGSDSSTALNLNRSMFFFTETFKQVYINTNGFVAFETPPAEKEYLGKMPSNFKMIAALLGDLDNSDGQGQVYFRQDKSGDILAEATEHITRALLKEKIVTLTQVFIVTWENIVAHGTSGRGDGLDAKRNTFQLVVALAESASYAILLYPQNGLKYFSTSVGGEDKPLEVGFNEGNVAGWWWNTKQGTYFRTTTKEETSIRDLTTKTNSAKNGVWVYKIGPSSTFVTIEPGTATSSPENVSIPPVTILPRQTDKPHHVNSTTFRYEVAETTDGVSEDKEEFSTRIPTQYQPTDPATWTISPTPTDPYEQEYPDPETITPTSTNLETIQQPYPDQFYTNRQPVRPQSRLQYPQVVVVDEEMDVDVFSYSLETCARNRNKCSVFADCQDYSNGYCCHCRPGFYGDGKDCIAEGKPQRITGKLTGRVFIGSSPTPIELDNKDVHAYVVANDGRAYVAISNIPDSVGPSLQPLSSIGGVIGWAFALQQPGYKNGFSLIGGVFIRQVNVVFQPGNERLSIKQEFKGIDEHDHLVVSTELEGRVPIIPQDYSVQINPYKEIYQYDKNLITSSSNRDYNIVSPDGRTQTRSYQWRQTIIFKSCPHIEATTGNQSTQQLSVDQIFVMFDDENHLIRYAMTNKIGSVRNDPPEQNPCFTGRHGCDISAACRPGQGLQFSCECTAGFSGDGRYCTDVDECLDNPRVCGPHAICTNQPGTFRCECSAGFVFASDGKTCVEENHQIDHCQRGSHMCDVPERARCSYSGGSTYACSCLPGFHGDGRLCRDVDECQQDRCHREGLCSNTPGSFTCQCRPGFLGDGFRCSPGSSEREMTPCEMQREKAQASSSQSSGFFSFLRPRTAPYVPQCDEHGAFEPTQCHTSIGQCWCVDGNGAEIPNTRTERGNIPLCINQAVTPSPLGPTPRPDVHPVTPGAHLLFAQSGRIEHIPLDGNRMKKEETKPLLHIPDRVVIGVAFDCVERMIYWTDITGPAISKARLDGGAIIPVITKDLQCPEGIAIDHVARLVFWTDSMRDTVEVSKLDGSQRRVLFDTDLVNPRPIVTNPAYGRLYWADWNRDGPKIEMSNMDGTDRSILVKDDLGLPNGLTFDLEDQQLCWADAGTQRVECMDPHRRLRRRIAERIQYPFGLISFGRSLYYTDWRRESIVAVDRHTEKEIDEFLPQRRSRLYGITTTTTQCQQVYNYCSNNGGCSHLCLPRLGGFTCRCPDNGGGQCVERKV